MQFLGIGGNNTKITGSFSTIDTVVAAPVGDGTLVSGSSTAGSVVSMPVLDAMGSWVALIKNYATGTVYSEASLNSTNGTDGDWAEVKGSKGGTAPGIENVGYAFTSSGYYKGNTSGFIYFRLRYLGVFTAGLTVTILTSTSVGATALISGLLGSNNIIGKVGIDQTTDGTTNAIRLLPETTKIIGTVNVAGTIPVSGAFFQTTQPVSISTTITDDVIDRATRLLGVLSTGANTIGAVNINGIVPVSLATNTPILAAGANIVGKVGIDQTTQGVTNAVSVTSQPELVTTGTITTTDIVVPAPSGAGALLSGTPTAGSYVSALAIGGNASVVIGITGLTTGTIYYEGSADSTTGIDGNWVALNMKQAGYINTQISSSATTNGLFRGNTAGIRYIRMRSVGALTGTPTITLRLSAGVAGEFLFGSIPTGTNSIGSVKLPDIATAGSLAALNATVTTAVNSQGIVAIQLTGTWAGTISFQGTEDPTGIAAPSTSWFNVNGVASVTGAQVTSTTANGQFRVNSGGYTAVRIIMTVFGSGSATVWINASIAPSMATLAEPLPTGTNNIGFVTANEGAAITTGITILQNATAATSNGTSLVVTGYGTAVLKITGTFVAIINFEFSTDGGATWDPIAATQIGAGDIFTSTTIIGSFRITCTALDLIRARVTLTSGTVTINGRASNAINAGKIVKLASGINTIGGMQLKAVSINGTSLTSINSAATTNAALIKALAGTIYSITAMNTNAAARYVRIYNLATSPTVGTSIPIIVIQVPPTSSKEIQFSLGIAMSTGIAYSITALAPATDATVVTAGDVQLTIGWN